MTATTSSRVRQRQPVAVGRPVWTHPALLILLIASAGAGTYWNSLAGPFIWDDQTAIVTNRTIQHLWPISGPLRPPRETPVAGRPIVNLSFAFNYAMGGLSETGYHVTNIAIHIGCALLLFGIVRRALLKSRPLFHADSTALVAALLWMLHPLQSEAVDYVTQRTESLMALFFLLTLYCAIRARRAGPPKGGHYRDSAAWQMLAVIACAGGMASKESMVTAPVIVLLYDRTFEFNSFGEAIGARKYLYGALAATWIELEVFVWGQPRSTAGLSTAFDQWTYFLNQVQMIARYLRLTVWPRDLILDYGLPRALGIRDVLPSALVVIPLLIATGVAVVRWPPIGFLAAAFFLALAPTSSVIPIASEVGAERRMYLPLGALAVLAVVTGRWLVNCAIARSAALKPDAIYVRATAVGLTTIVLVALAVRTVQRNADYASPVSLWRTVVDRRPHGRARMALATELIAAGDHAQAMSLLREAVRDYPDARFGLGTELIVDGKIDEGIAQLRPFIRDQPSNLNRIPARTLLAQALWSKGKLDEAANELRAVLKMVPSHDGVRMSLADLLFTERKYDEAAVEYRALLANQPNNSQVEDRLAMNLMAAGHANDAIEHWGKALQLDPQSAALNRSLAEAYLRQNDAARGETYAREAVRLEPGDSGAHNLLGIALASRGDVANAIAQFQEALQINPNDPQVQGNLERALGASRNAK